MVILAIRNVPQHSFVKQKCVFGLLFILFLVAFLLSRHHVLHFREVSPYFQVTNTNDAPKYWTSSEERSASPPLFLNRNLWTPQHPPEGILAQHSWTEKLNENDPSLGGVVPGRVSRPKHILIVGGVLSGWEWEKSQARCPGLIGPRCHYSKMDSVRKGMRMIPPEGVDAVVSAYDLGHSIRLPEDVVHIYHFIESSYHARATLRRQNDLLASFNTKISEIPVPYASWINYSESNDVHRNLRQSEQPPRNYAAGKSKMAAIFVSNCQSVNRRLSFVKKLQEYIPVDIYGACGSIECRCEEREKCFAKLGKEYKFYLAFENSNCREYVTEKLFENALMNDVIPVVMGAHPDDYKQIAPPFSYIHVEDFGNIQELAEYLKVLDGNDDAYNAYFRWKDSGELLKNPTSHFLCVMCAMLWYRDIVPPPPRQRPIVWNNTKEFCLPRGKWRWKTS